MKKLAIVAILILLLPALSSCARTLQSVKTIAGDPGTGTSQVYAVDIETAKKISKQILVEKGFIVQDQGNSLIARKTDFFFVEFTARGDGTKVRAVAVRWDPLDLFIQLAESTFHERLAEKIKK
jgi:hypothetical protein